MKDINSYRKKDSQVYSPHSNHGASPYPYDVNDMPCFGVDRSLTM